MAEPLRIAQIAPIALPVRSDSEGSIEQVVWLLCEELVRRGHEVTLFATGDSETSARLVHSYGRGYEHDEQLWDWRLHESVHAAAAFERASEFDVIHSHAYCFALPFTRLVPTPTAHTYHVEVDPDVVATFRRYPEACVVALSEWQRSNFGDLPRAEVIRHGIDVEAFPFGPEAGDYLLFLGRMIEDKGPVEAIELARSVGLRLVLAGPGEDWFEREVRPYVDGHQVQYAGPVDHVARNRLLSAAAALVLPLKYPEPFGLVMLEAMACGTPVVATALGAVPEIVEDGVTGFAAGSIADLRDRVAAALALDRQTIRARARERFGYARMADEHELLYRRLAAGGSGG